MKDFNYWKKLHESEKLEEFSTNATGLLWLKTKSIIRKELIAEFIEQNKLQLKETASGKQFLELFNLLSKDPKNSHKLLNKYIHEKSKKQLEVLDTEQLVSELFKLKHFEWGDYQNDLNKLLVSRYVKVYKSYDQLLSKFEKEIHPLVQAYVLNSWYNHWSSILIEHIFKSHKSVLPAVGQIKSVDFFINDIPFDLKVTYLPSEYIKEKRAEKGYPVELTYLKGKAKEGNIHFDKKAKPSDIYYEITEKLINKKDKFSNEVLKKLKDEKLEILKEAQENPEILSKWLYENQSAPRFGSENRMFLVLVNTADFANSWKLKRDLELLKPTIFSYLDKFKYNPDSAKKLEVKYNFPKNSTNKYSSLADVIFVVK
ncbi:MAG TPA: hypothetical protein VN026_08935 [Bacteroidia bacterium]|jgi:hypothetical protein|nr:hypothetical protein [Bacteroidia bacterium]